MNKPEKTDEAALRSTRALAHLLDESILIPGTNYRVGIDVLIGLIPGIGDLIGGILSTYIVGQAVQQGVSRATVVRMVVNVLIETVVGAVPVLGDVFDAIWKANIRNVRLLEGALVDQTKRARADTGFLFLVVGGLLTASLASAALVVWVVITLAKAMS